MKKIRIVFVLGLLLLASNAFGQKVTTDSMPGADWSKYQTYSWGEGTPAQNPITDQRIIAGVEAQLAAKGLKRVDADPDLIIVYHAATGEQKSVNWSNMGGWGRFGGMGTAQVDTVITGQLKVFLADAKAQKFLWNGIATDTVSEDPQKNAKKIDKALTKMFQKFPPAAKK